MPWGSHRRAARDSRNAPARRHTLRVDKPTREPPGEHSDADLLADAWSGLSAEVDRERGLAGRLKRAPTWLRGGLVLGGAVAVPLAAALLMPRADLEVLSPGRAMVAAGLLSVLAIVGAALAVRPMHVRAVSTTALIALASIASATFAGLALFPAGLDPVPQPSDTLLVGVVRCGMGVLGVAAIVFALARAARRDVPGEVVGAVALAALSGYGALGAVCPIDDLAHLVLGHALPAMLLVLAGLWAHVRPRGRTA